MDEPIKICYFNSLEKYCKNICGYKITLKKINDIIKETKCNFKKQNLIFSIYSNIFLKKIWEGPSQRLPPSWTLP